MRTLLAPLTDRFAERMARNPLAPVGRRVAGTELGVLLGYVAQRVLGQYDLLVPDDDGGATADRVYYVGANVLGLEKRFAFRPRDFRRWIALARGDPPRAVHRGALAPRRTSSTRCTRSSAASSPTRACCSPRSAVQPTPCGPAATPSTSAGIVGLFANDAQREAMDRMQALMSLLEGHGNAVMNHLGARLVDGQARMAAVLAQRRNARGRHRAAAPTAWASR